MTSRGWNLAAMCEEILKIFVWINYGTCLRNYWIKLLHWSWKDGRACDKASYDTGAYTVRKRRVGTVGGTTRDDRRRKMWGLELVEYQYHYQYQYICIYEYKYMNMYIWIWIYEYEYHINVNTKIQMYRNIFGVNMNTNVNILCNNIWCNNLTSDHILIWYDIFKDFAK